MIYGFGHKKQSGKDTVVKIWQYLLDYNSNGYTHPITEQDFNSYIENKHNLKSNWEKKSFACKLKQILCILTGCRLEQLEDESFKNSKLPPEWISWRVNMKGEIGYSNDNEYLSAERIELFNSKEELNKFIGNLNIYDIDCHYYEYLPTYREALQYIGTDLFRDKFHPSIWVNALFSEYTNRTVQFSTFKSLDGRNDPMMIKELPNWLISDVRFPNEAEAVKQKEGKLIRVDRKQFDIYKGKTIEVYNMHPSEIALDSYKDWDYIIDNNGTLEELIFKVKEIMINERIIK